MSNKYGFFLITTVYLIIVTFIITSTASMTGYGVGDGIPDTVNGLDSFNFDGVKSFLKMYVDILLFRVDGFPVPLSLIFFHSVALAHGLIIADIVKDVIPFT